jgi:glutathione S-transferase
MLDVKGVEYALVNVLPLSQRVHLRLAGFRRGTVPALKLDDGEKVQGSLEIARMLDSRWPEPSLFGNDPAVRERIEQAERWGERELQPIPRRLARFGAAHHVELRRWGLRGTSLPGADLLARVGGPLVSYYARTNEPDGRRANEEGVRADLLALPALLDRVDSLLADGTLAINPPNAASLQILSSVRALDAFDDLSELLGPRPCAAAARELFPRYAGAIPHFLPAGWRPWSSAASP